MPVFGEIWRFIIFSLHAWSACGEAVDCKYALLLLDTFQPVRPSSWRSIRNKPYEKIEIGCICARGETLCSIRIIYTILFLLLRITVDNLLYTVCGTIQYNVIKYNTILYYTILYYSKQFSATLYSKTYLKRNAIVPVFFFFRFHRF